jgi:hypothetical protein
MFFTLYPSLPADAEDLIRRCDFPAMVDNPLRRLMFPRSGMDVDEEEIQWNIDALRVSLEGQEMKFCKVCTGDGEPVGFAGWTPPVGDRVKSAEATSGESEDVNEEKKGKGNTPPKSLDIAAWLDATKKFKAEKDRVLQGRKNMWRKSPLPG